MIEIIIRLRLCHHLLDLINLLFPFLHLFLILLLNLSSDLPHHQLHPFLIGFLHPSNFYFNFIPFLIPVPIKFINLFLHFSIINFQTYHLFLHPFYLKLLLLPFTLLFNNHLLFLLYHLILLIHFSLLYIHSLLQIFNNDLRLTI